MIRKRTHWMSFVLAITVVLFVVVPNAIAQIPSDCLGRIWHITEGDATWAGTWTKEETQTSLTPTGKGRRGEDSVRAYDGGRGKAQVVIKAAMTAIMGLSLPIAETS